VSIDLKALFTTWFSQLSGYLLYFQNCTDTSNGLLFIQMIVVTQKKTKPKAKTPPPPCGVFRKITDSLTQEQHYFGEGLHSSATLRKDCSSEVLFACF